MKTLVLAFAVCGCAEMHRLAPLELQPPPKVAEVPKAKPDPIGFDIGNLSVKCIMNDQLLRYIVVQGDAITKAICDDPPTQQPGTKS